MNIFWKGFEKCAASRVGKHIADKMFKSTPKKLSKNVYKHFGKGVHLPLSQESTDRLDFLRKHYPDAFKNEQRQMHRYTDTSHGRSSALFDRATLEPKKKIAKGFADSADYIDEIHESRLKLDPYRRVKEPGNILEKYEAKKRKAANSKKWWADKAKRDTKYKVPSKLPE